MQEEGRSGHSPESRTLGLGASKAGRRRWGPASPTRRHPPVEGVEGKRIRGHPRALQVSLRCHLPKRQPSLHQGKHPPTVDGSNHSRSGESPLPQRLQGLEKGSRFFCLSCGVSWRQASVAVVTTRWENGGSNSPSFRR
jgi:hypothetical protein